MRMYLLASVAAALATGSLSACGETEVALYDESDRATERQAAQETPDYRFNPPLVNPDLRDIPRPLDTTPTPPVDSTNPAAPPPIPESVPG